MRAVKELQGEGVTEGKAIDTKSGGGQSVIDTKTVNSFVLSDTVVRSAVQGPSSSQSHP